MHHYEVLSYAGGVLELKVPSTKGSSSKGLGCQVLILAIRVRIPYSLPIPCNSKVECHAVNVVMLVRIQPREPRGYSDNGLAHLLCKQEVWVRFPVPPPTIDTFGKGSSYKQLDLHSIFFTPRHY